CYRRITTIFGTVRITRSLMHLCLKENTRWTILAFNQSGLGCRGWTGVLAVTRWRWLSAILMRKITRCMSVEKPVGLGLNLMTLCLLYLVRSRILINIQFERITPGRKV